MDICYSIHELPTTAFHICHCNFFVHIICLLFSPTCDLFKGRTWIHLFRHNSQYTSIPKSHVCILLDPWPNFKECSMAILAGRWSPKNSISNGNLNKAPSKIFSEFLINFPIAIYHFKAEEKSHIFVNS